MRVLSFALAAAVSAPFIARLPTLFGPPGSLPPLAVAALLLLPALPLARLTPRELIAAAAGLCITAAHLAGSGTGALALTVAAAGLFLAHGWPALATRPLAAGVAAGAVLAHPLLAPLAPGVAVTAAVAGVALLLDRSRAVADAVSGGAERRGEGLRLRGCIALGAGLYLVVRLAALTPDRPGGATVVAAGLAAVLVLLTAPPRSRSALGAIGGASGVAAVAAPLLWPPFLAIAAAAALAGVLLLIGRALVPAPGRRPGFYVSAGLLLPWGLLRIAPAGEGFGVAAAAALLTLSVLVLPRSAPASARGGDARVG